jgi:hypothetical protein
MDAATQVRGPPIRRYARNLSQSQIGWTLLHRPEGHPSDRMQGLVTESDWMDAATQVRRLVRQYARRLSQSQIGWTLLHRSEGLSDSMLGDCHRV